MSPLHEKRSALEKFLRRNMCRGLSMLSGNAIPTLSAAKTEGPYDGL